MRESERKRDRDTERERVLLKLFLANHVHFSILYVRFVLLIRTLIEKPLHFEVNVVLVVVAVFPQSVNDA